MQSSAIDELIANIVQGVVMGDVVPYLGPGALADVRDAETGAPIPADSDSLILAMNGGRPMAPKLMYEFPRAAMNLELKRGRRFIEQFLTRTYRDADWTLGAVHGWLAGIQPPYVIDINRDLALQRLYGDTPHVLVKGISRIGGTDYRFILFQHDGEHYRGVTLDDVDTSLPILFKPLGSPEPDAAYIASDADFVDYLTELMGGFGVPAFLKQRRLGKRYLFIGMRFLRDTERMVMSDITYGADAPAGWALIPEPSAKERRYCDRKGIEILELDITTFLRSAARLSDTAASVS